MKLYIEKWTTETINTGQLIAVDTQTLRDEYPELADLSDDDLILHITDYDLVSDILEQAHETLTAHNSSAEHCEDSIIDIHTSENITQKLDWRAWKKGCTSVDNIDQTQPELFMSKIPLIV